jgi:hypothetical protein
VIIYVRCSVATLGTARTLDSARIIDAIPCVTDARGCALAKDLKNASHGRIVGLGAGGMDSASVPLALP